MNNIRTGLAIALACTAALVSSCSGTTQEYISVIPYPASVQVNPGRVDVAGAGFVTAGIDDVIVIEAVVSFAQDLQTASGLESGLDGRPGAGKAEIRFVPDNSLADEEYTISVRRWGVEVGSSSTAGYLHAIQTLKQMLPVAIYGKAAAPDEDWSLPRVEIRDKPRFSYRGMHMDVSRHFFGLDEVKRYLDIMAVHKLNKLHWHLTDDQGWRIQIDAYPRLTEVGSVRKGTMIGKQWGSNDGIPHGGWYTKAEIREVIDYAARLGIDVIPEIDLPGHMLAALAAYPELGCTKGPYEVWGEWGVADDVLCAGREETMVFLENVLAEVAELFPSEYIHIGGDECPKVRWEKCPVCQAKIRELGLKDDEEFTAEHYLQSYVMERMEKFLATKGKKIIGWDEILEGTPGPDATIMSWRGSEGGIKASKMGHDVIMVPTSHFYFDYYQAKDTENEPFGIGGYVPIEKVYSYEPYTDDMDAAARAHVLGVQANLWTEYIATPEHLEYMLLPRLAALSEVQWCQREHKDWDRFLDGMTHEAAIYRTMGYNYATTVFQVIGEIRSNHDKQCVEVVLNAQGGVPIVYTLDGSEPEASCADAGADAGTGGSQLYNGPIEIRSGCTVKAIAVRDDVETRIWSRTFIDSKALGAKVDLLTQPLEKYRYGAPDSFTDGIRGGLSYATGEWAGWLGDNLSTVVEMGTGESFSQVALGILEDKGNDIFPPVKVTVSVSDDGNEFTEVGSVELPVPGAKEPDGIEDITVTFPETSARFIKVDAVTLPGLPAWHLRKGNKAFLFVDEIIVL